MPTVVTQYPRKYVKLLGLVLLFSMGIGNVGRANSDGIMLSWAFGYVCDGQTIIIGPTKTGWALWNAPDVDVYTTYNGFGLTNQKTGHSGYLTSLVGEKFVLDVEIDSSSKRYDCFKIFNRNVPAAKPDFQSGYDAILLGDNQKGLSELVPLAIEGDQRALALVGGVYHLGGSGIKKDNIQAHFYFSIGDALGHKIFEPLIEDTAVEMTLEEIETARSLVTSFLYMKCLQSQDGDC